MTHIGDPLRREVWEPLEEPVPAPPTSVPDDPAAVPLEPLEVPVRR